MRLRNGAGCRNGCRLRIGSCLQKVYATAIGALSTKARFGITDDPRTVSIVDRDGELGALACVSETPNVTLQHERGTQIGPTCITTCLPE